MTIMLFVWPSLDWFLLIFLTMRYLLACVSGCVCVCWRLCLCSVAHFFVRIRVYLCVNQISGSVPQLLQDIWATLIMADLSHNNFDAELPSFSPFVPHLDVRENPLLFSPESEPITQLRELNLKQDADNVSVCVCVCVCSERCAQALTHTSLRSAICQTSLSRVQASLLQEDNTHAIP